MKLLVFTFLAAMVGCSTAFCQSPGAGTLAAPLHAINAQTPRGLQKLFRYTGQPLPLVSAHRGGPSETLPENCIATFEDTLRHTYAILEVDPRMTKDGAIVVHHDATLDRTTTGTGALAEHTLSQLKALRLKDNDGNITDYPIPTLDELLQWARGKTVLVLDQKDVSVEARVKKIEEHRAESYAMLIVYSFEGARQCHQLNKNIMMEVMIPNQEKFHEFDRAGIPWQNVVAFVGHTPPRDPQLLRMIHAKGACCIAGTSRNLDRELVAGQDPQALEPRYRELLQQGVDLIETDLPRQVGQLLYDDVPIPSAKADLFELSSADSQK